MKAGEMKEWRVGRFRELLGMVEVYKRVNL